MKLFACPRCHGALSTESELTGLIRCASCGPYPKLGGVPILLADPFTYCAQFRDSILATLAEHELADRTAVTVVDAFARGHGASEVFADDWTEHEGQRSEPPALVAGPAKAALGKLLLAAEEEGPAVWFSEQLGALKRRGTALEIGCGAGERSEVLSKFVERLVIADRSLRVVL